MTQVRKKQIQPEMPKGFSLFLSDGERSPILLFLCDFPSFKKIFLNLLFLATLGLPYCEQAFSSCGEPGPLACRARVLGAWA